MAFNLSKTLLRTSTSLKRTLPLLTTHSVRNFARGEEVKPYRPWPADEYFYPTSAKYYLEQEPVKQNEQEEYQDEEIYLDELEDRMRLYDKKYSMPEEMKKVWNEFGIENVDDKAFSTYGQSFASDDNSIKLYGRGKKINPAQYMNPGFWHVNRNPIPPVQYMSREQVRRVRGSLAAYREMPPEQGSIWKYWNIYSVFGASLVVMTGKELFVMMDHEMFEAMCLGMWFGIAGAFFADWWAWMSCSIGQEQHDRDYFTIKNIRDKFAKTLINLRNKPNEIILSKRLLRYREILSEKVLRKTLDNQINRLTEKINNQLKDKINEESAARKRVEEQWKRTAMDETLEYFEGELVRNSFMSEALSQFTSGDTAKIKPGQTQYEMQTNDFQDRYNVTYNNVRENYINNTANLPWVFRSKDEINNNRMSTQQRENEYTNRINQWQSSRNTVDAPMPAFA